VGLAVVDVGIELGLEDGTLSEKNVANHDIGEDSDSVHCFSP